MATYTITKDSVKTENGMTSFMVTFDDEAGNVSAEQYYEVMSENQDEIYAALDKTLASYCVMQQQSSATVFLDEGVAVTQGSKSPSLPE